MAPSSLFVSSIILALGGGGFIPSVSALACPAAEDITGGWSCAGLGECKDVSGNYYKFIRNYSPFGESAASCITKCGDHVEGLTGATVDPATKSCLCHYSNDQQPNGTLGNSRVGEGAVTQTSLQDFCYCLKNDRYGITATLEPTASPTPEPTPKPTTALSVYEKFRVVHDTDSSCGVMEDGDDEQLECRFKTVDKSGNKDSVAVAVPTQTSLEAQVVFGTCVDAAASSSFTLSGTEGNSDAKVSGSAMITLPSATEKNCGDDAVTENNGKVCSVSREFCARASLFDMSTTPPMEVMAEILEGSVTYKYSTSGDFDTTVTTKAYEAKSATTADQVTEDGLSAYQCDGDGVTSTNAMDMGSILNICVYTLIAGASVDITSLELKQGDGTVLSTLIQNSQTTLVTSSKAIDSVDDGGTIKTKVLVISSLMSPTIFDGATFSENDSGLDTAILTATGAAKIIYGGNVRKLMNIRLLQAPGGESFDVEVDLVRNELPAIAMSKNNAEKTIGVLGAMVSMAFGAYMIM